MRSEARAAAASDPLWRLNRALLARAVIEASLSVLGRSLIAAALLLLALAISHRGWLGLSLKGNFWFIAAAVGWFVVDAIRHLRRIPSPVDLARLSEARTGLRERLSTAIELRDREGTGRLNEVENAQLADARGHASRIDPAQVYPTRLPRTGVIGAGLLAVMLTVHLSLPSVTVPAPSSSSNASLEDRTETIELLKRASELLEAEAELARDPYLAALAKGFADLAERAQTGAVSGEELEHQFSQLAEHLEGLYGEAFGAPSPPLPGSTEEEQLSSLSIDGELMSGVNDAAESSSTAQQRLDIADLVGRLEKLEEGLRADESGGGARRRGRLTEDIGYIESGVPRPKRAEDETAESFEEMLRGTPIGAAEQSGEGAGDAAGQGSQELASDPLAVAPESRDTEDFLLPEATSPEGEKIRRLVAPEVQPSTVEDGSVAPGAWRPQQGVELRREILSPRQREVVHRYFEPAEDASDSNRASRARP